MASNRSSGEASRGQLGQHKLSDLLSSYEKALLVQWLDLEACVTASGVCQLLVNNPGAGHWSIAGTGIVCMVKDYRRRIYAIQFFDVSGHLLLEQRLYRNFIMYSKPNFEKLSQFEGDQAVYGLNFADLDEARAFKSALQNFDQRRQKQVHTKPRAPAPPTPIPVADSAMYRPLDPGTLRKNKRKKKLTRSDISLPSQFRHLSHFDISPEKSFVKQTARAVPKLDPRICNLLESIGEPIEKLNIEDQEFICNFIEAQGGLGNVESELSRKDKTVRSRSPLPFNQIVSTPGPAAPKPRIAFPPPPPPPSKMASISPQPTGPPPPPPGPPPSFDSFSFSSVEQSRFTEALPGDLMSQIIRGKQLRPVGTAAPLPRATTDSRKDAGGGIAQALAKALAERREHMKSDEETSDNAEDDSADSNEGDWD